VANEKKSNVGAENPVRWPIGAAFLTVAFLASVMLVIQHFGTALPGCGPESACHSLARSVWGSIPGLGWPTSFVGVAYFDAMLVAWILSRGRFGGPLRALLGLGVLASLVFLGVMIVEQQLCPYCLIAHLAHLAFALSVWRAPALPSPSVAMMAAVGSFVGLTLVLGIANQMTKDQRESAAENERERSVRQMVAAAGGDASVDPTGFWAEAGFKGRYLHGPESAPIRVVMFTDYQCPDCRRVEGELRAIMDKRTDLAVTIKHFPMCQSAGGGEVCNRHVSRTLHENACWAARAAEAAGILGGEEAFWEMHFWLFERKGIYSPSQLQSQIQSLGLDATQFEDAMRSDETLARVHADVDEAFGLGLHYTPMIFINGVELKGWNARTALARSVDQVGAANPAPKKMGSDRPVLALAKYVGDWQDQRKKTLPADKEERIFGEADGQVEVVVFGDYQEENSALIDSQIRDYLKGNEGIRYNFRHYPVDPKCNRALPTGVPESSIHPDACWAASVAEAAGRAGGAEAFQKAHAWLMENSAKLFKRDLEGVCAEAGVSPAEVAEGMKAAEVETIILEDCRAGTATSLTSIPAVYVNGRWIPRLKRDGANVMDAILAAAGKEAAESR